jgi:3-oxoacyl-[acyl-carrier-protein] synthase-3
MIATTAGASIKVGITGVGACVPDQIVTNDDIADRVETSDEWIIERTGIKQRHVAGDGVAASDLASPAAEAALAQAGLTAADLDLVLVATITPDMPFPATASVVANRIGAGQVAAYDLQAGCTGFVYAVTQAYATIVAGLARNVLVVGVDLLTKYLDWDDRGTCILFGDGAGAAVIGEVEAGGFLSFELGNDGGHAEDLYVPAGGTRLPASQSTVASKDHTMKMNGREVFRFATRVMVSSAQRALESAGYRPEDVDLYVPHQANKRIIDHAVRELGIPEEKVVVNVDRFGNTSAASIPICLDEMLADGIVEPGARVLMTGVGTGLTWGSALIEWPSQANGAGR